jgi:hypothetical protein
MTVEAKPKKRVKARKSAPKPKKEALAKRVDLSLSEKMQEVLMEGNLQSLSLPDRMMYYRKVCQSLGLNPLTRPFDFISFQGKVILYARKDCTDQLRRIHGVSVSKLTRTTEGDLTIIEVEVKDRTGRTDVGIGAWATQGLKGEAAVNGLLKAETKAKRRATLSICGLGLLDSSELDTIDYDEVSASGRVVEIDGGVKARAELPEAGKTYELAVIMAQKDTDQTLGFKDRVAKHHADLQKQTPAQIEVLLKRFSQPASPKPETKEEGAATPIPASSKQVSQPLLATVPAGEEGGAVGRAAASSDYYGITFQSTPSGAWEISGPQNLLREHREVLKKVLMHNALPALVCSSEDCGKLMAQLERLGVKHRMVGDNG